ADYDEWHEAGAGVGIKLGEGLIALDIDCMDYDKADICAKTATQILGASENRIGKKPKRLKLYRISEPVPYKRVKFDGGMVEVLSDGRQFVAHGIHPDTGEPYTWPRGITPYAQLPEINATMLAQYLEEVAHRLPHAKVESGALPNGKAVDPAMLKGKPENIERAMAALPNHFDDRADYIKVGQALTGALPHD